MTAGSSHYHAADLHTCSICDSSRKQYSILASSVAIVTLHFSIHELFHLCTLFAGRYNNTWTAGNQHSLHIAHSSFGFLGLVTSFEPVKQVDEKCIFLGLFHIVNGRRLVPGRSTLTSYDTSPSSRLSSSLLALPSSCRAVEGNERLTLAFLEIY